MSATSPIEPIFEGITLEWLNDHQIAVFKLNTIKNEAIDAWMTATKAVANGEPGTRPCLIMHDASSNDSGITSYMRMRLKEFDDFVPAYASQTFVAIILPSTLMSHLITFWYRTYKPGPGVQVQLFTGRDLGLKWLESKMGER